MKLLYLVFLCLFLVTSVFGITDTLPSEAELYKSLATYYEQKTQAELIEFEETTKGEWLKYLPSVGITYTLDNQPRPAASLNTGIIYQAKKSKQRRASKRKAIVQVNRLAHQEDRIRLRQLLDQYRMEQEALVFQEDIFEIDRQLFLIEEAKYEKNQIPPSEFLKIKRGYLVKGFELGEGRRKLSIQKGNALVLAKMID